MYSHRVEVLRSHPLVGGLVFPDSFRTTADAVQAHQDVCERRLARGEIVSYSILPLEAA